MDKPFVQISQVTVDDFMSMLDSKISQALEKFQGKQNILENEKEFYTRKETSELLNVSFGTLFNWHRDGILKAKKIGNRVYYSKDEVVSKLKLNS